MENKEAPDMTVGMFDMLIGIQQEDNSKADEWLDGLKNNKN